MIDQNNLSNGHLSDCESPSPSTTSVVAAAATATTTTPLPSVDSAAEVVPNGSGPLPAVNCIQSVIVVGNGFSPEVKGDKPAPGFPSHQDVAETDSVENGHGVVSFPGLSTANGTGSGGGSGSGLTPWSANSIDFPKLNGEQVSSSGLTSEGRIVLTNYRLVLSFKKETVSPVGLPLGIIDHVETRDLFYLHIYTKHVRSLVCSFPTGEECTRWTKRLQDAVASHLKLEDLFCFKFFKAFPLDLMGEDDKGLISILPVFHTSAQHDSWALINREAKRMGFTDSGLWTISQINKDFKLSISYPRYLVVPVNITDKDLDQVATFRYSRRIPTPVWRYQKNGCIIARSSQPEVGWLGWRSGHDESLLHSFVTSCFGPEKASGKKLLVLDARSYAAAVANRAKGGGCECPEYYPSCEVQFMGLANIHSIRKSYQSIRYLCENPADQFNWLTLLDNSKWLNHISGLIKSALIAVDAIDEEERPVLVHCSDGWDRTPQIVALAELMLDPYYRTIEGFQTLVEREWLEFGHKFAERCGNAPTTDDPNERSPVFVQWLDCVHQIVRQFPCSFEFNQQFLGKLVHHTYSCLFGTFTGNNMHERYLHQVYERSHLIWSYFNASRHQFVNHLFVESEQVLRPSWKVKDMIFWTDVYAPVALPSGSRAKPATPAANGILPTEAETILNGPSHPGKELELELDSKPADLDLDPNGSGSERNETESDMDTIASEKQAFVVKTRSCDNLDSLETQACFSEAALARVRRNSDPNLFRSLSIIDEKEFANDLLENRNLDVMRYLREVEMSSSNSSTIRDRDVCDRDALNEVPLDVNRDNHVQSLCNLFVRESLVSSANLSASMLSTETLISAGNAPLSPETESMESRLNGEANEPCPRVLVNRSYSLSTSTSTTELSNSSIQHEPPSSAPSTPFCSPFTPFDRENGLFCNTSNCQKRSVSAKQSHPQEQCQPLNHPHTVPVEDNLPNYASNGKHTRTPSSGCPATPNDDQASDTSQPSIDSLIDGNHLFDFDGQVVVRDHVQTRLLQVIAQHTVEINALRKELYNARLALCQQFNSSGIFRESKTSCSSDEVGSVLTNGGHSNGIGRVEREESNASFQSETSLSSLDSWVNVLQTTSTRQQNGSSTSCGSTCVKIAEPIYGLRNGSGGGGGSGGGCDHVLHSLNGDKYRQLTNCRRSGEESFCSCLTQEQPSLAN